MEDARSGVGHRYSEILLSLPPKLLFRVDRFHDANVQLTLDFEGQQVHRSGVPPRDGRSKFQVYGEVQLMPDGDDQQRAPRPDQHRSLSRRQALLSSLLVGDVGRSNVSYRQLACGSRQSAFHPFCDLVSP